MRCTGGRVLFSALLLWIAGSCFCSAATTVVAKTKNGAVRGLRMLSQRGRPFLAFYNLPYAKPPVGPLRFKAPEPPDSWIHVRDATVPGTLCTQKNLFLRHENPVGSEDCLYLNVFTSQISLSGSLPVMFWIHGGGWISGGGPLYEPEFLLDYDIILVTINYRLGPLGFLSTEDSESPGNYGLKDQVAALLWVQENIAAFGGNPNSVTVFGESAGGASAHYLIISPLSKGLFHRAILQSGTAFMPWALPSTNALQTAYKLASLLGCPTNSSSALVQCLRTIDDFQLVSRDKDFMEWDIDPMIPFGPVIEGKQNNSFLSEHPLFSEPVINIPLMIGLNQDDGCLRSAAIYENKVLLKQIKNEFKRVFPISGYYAASKNADLISEKIYNFYFSNTGISAEALTDLYTDALFLWNADEAVKFFKDLIPVYYYLFNYRGQQSFSTVFGKSAYNFGVCHADELLYLFPNTKLFPHIKRTETDFHVTDLITKLWTGFAITGNPTPNDELPNWPYVKSEDELEHLEIGSFLQVKKGLFQERINFWRSLPLREDTSYKLLSDEL